MYDENGQKIVYTWTEGTLPSGYSLTSSPESNLEVEVPAEEEGGEPTKVIVGTLTTLTNTYTPGMTSVQVTVAAMLVRAMFSCWLMAHLFACRALFLDGQILWRNLRENMMKQPVLSSGMPLIPTVHSYSMQF